jgi:Ala-tRNA(Pro) deacylase
MHANSEPPPVRYDKRFEALIAPRPDRRRRATAVGALTRYEAACDGAGWVRFPPELSLDRDPLSGHWRWAPERAISSSKMGRIAIDGGPGARPGDPPQGRPGRPAMPAQKLKEFLDGRGVKYVTVSHSLAYTAQEVAASAHVSGKEMAKTLVVKLDGKMALFALPASEKLNMQRVGQETGAKTVELATEAEFGSLFPGCELGAMPPFGNLYGLDTYVTDSLARDPEIAFNAGTHTEVIRMAYADFERLVTPKRIAMPTRPA